MPAKTDARREIVLRVRQRLPVVAQAKINRESAGSMNAVLNECRIEPLRQFVTADTEVDWLRVVLHVSKRQLTEWWRCGVQESEGTEDGSAGFAPESAGRVMGYTPTKTKVVLAARP